ncbi:MAG: ABC transporter permease [Candidatus Hydrogenedentota bacterium]
MSLWRMAWQYMWNRRLTTILTVLSVALGVALITGVLTLRDETEKRFVEEGQLYDLVVGAAGSPLQLVLSSVYFMDTPTGNIAYEEYEQVRDHEAVNQAFPIGLGDTYEGYRIVGTTRELFDFFPQHVRDEPLFPIAEGRYFEDDFEAVIGSMVARRTGLGVGDTFAGVHGFMETPEHLAHTHDEHPYEVVGILEPTDSPNDRAIYTTLESVWLIHDHGHDHGHDHSHDHDHGHDHGHDDGHDHEHGHDHSHDHDHGHDHAHDDGHDHEHGHDDGHDHEHGHDHAHDDGHDHEVDAQADPGGDAADLMGDQVTAVLVSLHTPGDRFSLRQEFNENLHAMAAIPVMEIWDLYENLLGTIQGVLLAIGYLVVIIAALSILIGLYLSILQRKRDLAIMRALGASAPEIVGSVLIEAFLVTVLGIVSGWILGNIASWLVGLQLTWSHGLVINAWGLPTAEMLTAFAAVGVVGILAGIVPAWQAYQTDVARDLAEL